MTQSNVSRHLAKLRGSGIITASKDGQWVHYKLSSTFVKENELLANYLKLEFGEGSVYKRDLNRYRVYNDSGYSCQHIRSDKAMVEKYINDLGGKNEY